MSVKIIGDIRTSLGECPTWVAREQAVYWIDIEEKRIYRSRLDGSDPASWDMPSHLGLIAERATGGLIVALQDGIHAFDPATGALSLLVALEADLPENRPNDGKCDARGRLWLGTMHVSDHDRPSGSFYRIDPDLSVTRISDGLRIPNGLAWSPDDKVMYHADTPTDEARRYDFTVETGTLGPWKTAYTSDHRTAGGIDGAAMDADGGYWVALYGGGRVVRVGARGQADAAIALPASQPTMPAFAGPDMRTLLITTSRLGMADEDLRAEPAAGALLMVETDVRGHPVYAFGG